MTKTTKEHKALLQKYKDVTKCTKKGEEVHHTDRGLSQEGRLNKIDNAELLCKECHDHVRQKDIQLKDNRDFDDITIQKAKERAKYICECTRINCPHNKKKR